MDARKEFGNNHGDVRGQSVGNYYPFDLVGVQEGWVICNLLKPIDPQIKEAREKDNIYPYGKAKEAECIMGMCLDV